MDRHDVLVIGAGPAGCATAISCAAAGLRVLLLEHSLFPRERPGETLPAGIEPLLQQLGVDDVVNAGDFLRHTGHWVQWEADRHFSPFGGSPSQPWRGYQIPRAVLDSLLLQRAIALGVQVHIPCHAQAPLIEGGHVVGIQTPQGPQRCRWLVDASGSAAWLSRHIGQRPVPCSPQLIARYGYVTGDLSCLDAAPTLQSTVSGWHWVAKITPTLAHWTCLDFRQPSPHESAPHILAGYAPLSAPRGADVTWRLGAAIAGPRYLVTGDAACVLDPASSHGVLRAVMSGMMAAHTIGQILARPQSQMELLAQYQQWLGQWYWRDVRALRTLYRAHPYSPSWCR